MKRDNEMGVADVLEKDQERQIQGVDIGDEAGQSLNDFISEREDGSGTAREEKCPQRGEGERGLIELGDRMPQRNRKEAMSGYKSSDRTSAAPNRR